MAVAAGASLAVIELLATEAKEILYKTNKFGETPLHVALRSHASDTVIECLIRHGPNARHMRDKANANLPIHVAAASGCSIHVARMLLEKWPELIVERNGAHLKASEVALKGGNCSKEVIRLFSTAAEPPIV